jgi:hypothetical protein
MKRFTQEIIFYLYLWCFDQEKIQRASRNQHKIRIIMILFRCLFLIEIKKKMKKYSFT